MSDNPYQKEVSAAMIKFATKFAGTAFLIMSAAVYGQVTSAPYPDPSCGVPAADIKYSNDFKNALHQLACFDSDSEQDLLTPKFFFENKNTSSSCDDKSESHAASLQVVQKALHDNASLVIDACGYRMCQLARQQAPAAALEIMGKVCGGGLSPQNPVRLDDSSVYSLLKGDTGETIDFTIGVHGDPNEELPYQVHASRDLGLTPDSNNPKRLKIGETILRYKATVPSLDNGGLTFKPFFVTVGSRGNTVLHGVLGFEPKTPSACTEHTKDQQFCRQCSFHLSWTNQPSHAVLPFECAKMPPGSDIEAILGTTVHVHGWGPADHWLETTSISLRQYDEMSPSDAYHLTAQACANNACRRKVGGFAGPYRDPTAGWDAADVKLLSKTPRNGKNRFDIIVEECGPQPGSGCDGVGDLVIQTRENRP